MIIELNIVHSVDSLAGNKGGPSYSIASLASAQAQIPGSNVHLLVEVEPGSRPVAASQHVRLHAATENRPQNVLITRGMLRALWEKEHTVLHDHGAWLPHNVICAGYAARRDLPYVISPHGMLEPWALAYHPKRKRIARWLFQDRLLANARCLIATSEKEFDNIRKLGFGTPIAMIPNGVDTIPAMEPSEAESNKKTALFLSRIHPVKGLIHAIEAWHALRPRDWRFKIVGPSENGHREELQALVQRYGLSEDITFHDAVSGADKWREFSAADVFLLPSMSENFGVAIAEALAAKVPVVTTVGTPWTGIADRQCGWYVDTGTEPFISALRAVFNSTSDQLRAMGERGHHWMMAEYQWPAIASRSMMLYRWILGLGPKPDFVSN